jgi:hypothetical protein
VEAAEPWLEEEQGTQKKRPEDTLQTQRDIWHKLKSRGREGRSIGVKKQGTSRLQEQIVVRMRWGLEIGTESQNIGIDL